MRPNPLVLSLGMLVLAACASQSPPAPTATAPEAAAVQKAPGAIYLGTGGVTGVYYPAGGAICRMFNKGAAQGMSCKVESTGGSVENVERIRSGDLDMGIVQSDAQFEVYQGSGDFAAAGAYPELRAIMSLHAEPFTVVARSDAGVTTFDDLKGKRVNVGNPGSGQRATMDVVMAAKGWTVADFAAVTEQDSTDQSNALAADQVDAVVFTVGHPSGAIQEATKVADARLIPVTGPAIDGLLAENPYYAKAVIPGRMYRGTNDDTPTFGVRATLVTSASAPDEVVYQVTKSVFENFDEFKQLHPALMHLSKEEMVSASLSAPLHPGAERYYREAGLM